MIKNALIITALLIAGAFLNSSYNPARTVVSKSLDRIAQFAGAGKSAAVGLASDVQHEVAARRN